MVKHSRSLVSTVLLLITLLATLPVQAAPDGKDAKPQARATTTSFVLDGVTLTISTPTLPDADFAVAPAGDASQLAIATAHHPYREFTVLAVPFGTKPGFERVPVARTGGVEQYRTALSQYRQEQGSQPQAGLAVSLFGQPVPGLVNLVKLNLDSPTLKPTLIVEWVVEAGNRLWIVRYASEQPATTRDQGQLLPDELSQLTLSSLNLEVPTTLTPDQPAAAKSPQAVVAQPGNLPTPAWWNGDCDYNTYYNRSGWSSYRLGAVYQGMPACGPRPYSDGAPDVDVRFFSGAWGVYEWECVELSMRFLYQAYGVNPYPANGSQVVWNYSGNRMRQISNGATGNAPQPGDVLSYGATSTDGHTSVVTESNVNSAGNGTIAVIEENSSAGGSKSLAVNGWYVSSGVSGWLRPNNVSSSYEAESWANSLNNGAARSDCGACSGGQKVGWVGYNATLQFNNISVANAGTYHLTIYYASGETRYAQVSINSQWPSYQTFASTGSWENVGSISVDVWLNAGNNTVLLYDGGGWTPDFDRITIN